MNNVILTIAIAITILATQNFLSTRKHWAFGALLPMAYTTFSIWFIMNKNVDTRMIVRLCIGLVIFLGIWCDGRVKLRKNLSKEMDKMISKDIA